MLSNLPKPKDASLDAGASESGFPKAVEKLISAIQLPLLEPGPGSKRQVGSERGDEVYTVDLSRYTCTCHSFRKGRATFGENDIRRCCRHIARLLLCEKRSGKLSDFLHVMLVHRLNYGRGLWADSVRHPMRYIQIGGEDVLLVKGDSGGVDVFAPKQPDRLGYGIFGYSVARVRWTDLGMPKHHQLIAELIHQSFKVDRPSTSKNIAGRAMSETQPRVE